LDFRFQNHFFGAPYPYQGAGFNRQAEASRDGSFYRREFLKLSFNKYHHRLFLKEVTHFGIKTLAKEL